MKYRYSKFVADLLDEIDLESLVSQLSDLLLVERLQQPVGSAERRRPDDAGAARRDPGRAAERRRAVGRDARTVCMDDQARAGASGQAQRDQLEALIQRIIERLTEQGYVSMAGKPDAQRLDGPGGAGQPTGRRASRSPTRRSTFSATARCAICSDRSAAAAPAGTTRASWRRASKPAARRARTSSATR